MNSKVIQISTTQKEHGTITTIALCEDGSIWSNEYGGWACILKAPL
jgi:hypothetical protein